MKLMIGVTLLCLLSLAGSGGEGLGNFTGRWESGFDDRDDHGQYASTGYQLHIQRDGSYQLDYRSSRSEKWSLRSSGKVALIRINVDGQMRDGIQLGNNHAVRTGRTLSVDVGGQLRTFRRVGSSHTPPCISWAITFCLVLVGLKMMRERFEVVDSFFRKGKEWFS